MPEQPGLPPDRDAVLAERVARLRAQRAATGTGATGSSPTGSRVAVTPARRRHPAAGSRAGALAMSFAATGALTYAFTLTDSSASPGTAATAATVVATPATPATPSGNAGTTGSVVDGGVYTNRYGDVQVQATFAANGSLASVQVLQVPNTDGRSYRINESAVPTLNSEAVTAQSSHVDTVSGATYTSTDYQQSLQSAIDAARASGITQLT